jgi:phytoene dehydrogenase-like protein
MGYLRPNELCSQYSTPIKGLYVGGASTYPGGLVLFGPGYNAAGAIVDDLGVKRWWKEPDSVTQAREKGLI